MKTVSLDVHTEASQLTVVSAEGEVLLEMKVATNAEELRRVVGAIAGPKRVVFEEGPLSAMLHEALAPLAEEVISCDPSHNALIALAEDSNDERDARRLATLARLGAVRPVYAPDASHRRLRSLLRHDRSLGESMTGTKNRIKALARRQGLRCRGASVYQSAGRAEALGRLSDAAARWQMQSLYRQLDALRRERVGAHRVIEKAGRPFRALLSRLTTIPGVGPVTARTLVAWLADPGRFRSWQALNAYAGLGLGQGWTNWQPTGRARASRRGNREVKRVLFIAAEAAIRGDNALARRYQARRACGWDPSKAIRDTARTLLKIVEALWRKKSRYDDSQVRVPTVTPDPVRRTKARA